MISFNFVYGTISELARDRLLERDVSSIIPSTDMNVNEDHSSLSLFVSRKTIHNVSGPQAAWISAADVLRCNNDD